MDMTISAHCAKAAIMVLAGRHFTSMLDRTDAVLALVSATDAKERTYVASFAVNFILNEADKHTQLTYFQSLARALAIAEVHQVNVATAEHLVRQSACHGFIGRFPELPLRLLSRPMTEEEVTLLVDHYTKDTSTRSSNTEEELRVLARRYCTDSVAKEHMKRIDEFVYQFENGIDI